MEATMKRPLGPILAACALCVAGAARPLAGQASAAPAPAELRVEVQGGVLRLPAWRTEGGSERHGAVAGLRVSHGRPGRRPRALALAAVTRTRGRSAYGYGYSEVEVPLLFGGGYQAWRGGAAGASALELGLYVGWAYSRLTLPAGRTSEEVFGSTDAAGGSWSQAGALEVLYRRRIAGGLTGSLSARAHGQSLFRPHRLPLVLAAGIGR
jgi:hypothetical protein